MATEVKTWRHSRKGLITGTIIGKSGEEFVKIQLAGDQTLQLVSRSANPNFDDGEIITVREEFLTWVETVVLPGEQVSK